MFISNEGGMGVGIFSNYHNLILIFHLFNLYILNHFMKNLNQNIIYYHFTILYINILMFLYQIKQIHIHNIHLIFNHHLI